jgi:hypothetical protein
LSGTAAAASAGFFLLRSLAAHQFVEAAVGIGFVHECEIVLVKFAEEILPGDLFERPFAAESGKIYAQDAGFAVLLCGFDGCWNTAAFFGPSAYLVMIGSDSCFGHMVSFS